MAPRESQNPFSMNRRRFLTATGAVGLTAVAGCTGESDTDPVEEGGAAAETSSSTTTKETTATTTEEPGEAAFEVVSIDGPSKMEIGATDTFSITVKNTGDAEGTWTQTVSGKVGDEDWEKMGDISLDVPAGQTATWTSGEIKVNYQTVITYRLEEAAKEYSIQFVAADLGYGETYTSPDSMAMTATKVELKSYYEYKDYSGATARQRADDGMQWAFVTFKAENKGSESQFTPLSTDLSVIAGNQQYDSEYTRKESGMFEGGEINPGIVREGWLAYQIPADLSKGDFEVIWSDDNFTGSWTARWSA